MIEVEATTILITKDNKIVLEVCDRRPNGDTKDRYNISIPSSVIKAIMLHVFEDIKDE